MSWDTVKFNELYAVDSKNGIYKSAENHGTGTKIVNMGELFAYGFIGGQEMRRIEVTDKEKESFGVIDGDLLFARRSLVESGAGKSSIIKDLSEPTVFESSIIRVRLDKNKCNPLFYYYWLKSYDGRSEISSLVNGVNVKGIKSSALKDITVAHPSMEIQNRIADILYHYDELIENNQQQIKLLEEAAQRLYKEWFVDLRFPGYEETEIVDGVPEGWSRKKVVECLEMHIGGGWGKENIVGKNTIPGKVIRGTDINDIKSGVYNDVPLRYHTENDKNKRALKSNDIVFELSNGNIDNIGRSLLIDDLILKNCGDNTICASFCKLFRPKDRLHSLVLYLEIQDMQSSGRIMPYKKQGSNGINNFAFEDFLEHLLLVPNDYSILATFEDIISKISILQNQLSLLIQARDRLLPKLMNGEIEV